MRHKTVTSTWELRSYDVWGNAKDGYEVNDSCKFGTVEIDLRVEKYNVGTPQEFESAHPSDKQIRKVFGLTNIRLDIDGDDLHVYVNRERDGYPIGEMFCTSHDSLSPIREKASAANV